MFWHAVYIVQLGSLAFILVLLVLIVTRIKNSWLSISVRKGETELPLKIYNKYYQDKREVKFKFYCVNFVRKVVST